MGGRPRRPPSGLGLSILINKMINFTLSFHHFFYFKLCNSLSFHIFPKSFINKSKPSFSFFTSLEPPPPSKTPISIFVLTQIKSNQYLSMIIEIRYKFKSSIIFQLHKFDTNIIIHLKLGCYIIANSFSRYVRLFINLRLIYRLIFSN